MARAEVLDFLLNGVRKPSTDEPLSSGKVYSYDAGTTTPKSLFTNPQKSATASNPVVLGADGTAKVYGDGYYKIVIKDSADVDQYTYDNLFLGIDASAAAFGGTSSGAANTYSITLAPGITAAADANGMLISFIAHQSNTSAVTLSVNGVNYSLSDAGGVALGAGAIVTGDVVLVLVQTAGARLITPRESAVTTWAPVFGAATGTWTGSSTYCRYTYSADRKRINFGIFVSGSHSAITAYVTMTMPVVAATLGAPQYIPIYTNDAAAPLLSTGTLEIQDGSSTARIYKGDRSNIAGAPGTFSATCTGSYWIA